MSDNVSTSHIPFVGKILLVTAERVGDALFCVPGIHLLKKHRPNLQLDILAFSPGAAQVFDHNPDIAVSHVTANKRQIKRIAKTYPLVINLTYEAIKYLDKLPTQLIAIGFPDRKKHRTEQVLEFISGLIGSSFAEEDRRYLLYPQATDFTRLSTLLQQHGVDNKQHILIGCHLGCHRVARRGWKFWSRDRHQHRKVWPLENYVQLAQQLKAANPNIQLLITGSASEKFLAKPFTAAAPWVINLIGETSLFEVSALMDQLAVYITHDTGTLHIACARNTSLVALFGPTAIEFTGPYPIQPNHTILRKDSMADITVDEVYEAVLERIK